MPHSWRDDGDYPTAVEALLRAGSRYHQSWLPTGHDTVDAVLARHPGHRVE